MPSEDPPCDLGPTDIFARADRRFTPCLPETPEILVMGESILGAEEASALVRLLQSSRVGWTTNNLAPVPSSIFKIPRFVDWTDREDGGPSALRGQCITFVLNMSPIQFTYPEVVAEVLNTPSASTSSTIRRRQGRRGRDGTTVVSSSANGCPPASTCTSTGPAVFAQAVLEGLSRNSISQVILDFARIIENTGSSLQFQVLNGSKAFETTLDIVGRFLLVLNQSNSPFDHSLLIPRYLRTRFAENLVEGARQFTQGCPQGQSFVLSLNNGQGPTPVNGVQFTTPEQVRDFVQYFSPETPGTLNIFPTSIQNSYFYFQPTVRRFTARDLSELECVDPVERCMWKFFFVGYPDADEVYDENYMNLECNKEDWFSRFGLVLGEMYDLGKGFDFYVDACKVLDAISRGEAGSRVFPENIGVAGTTCENGVSITRQEREARCGFPHSYTACQMLQDPPFCVTQDEFVQFLNTINKFRLANSMDFAQVTVGAVRDQDGCPHLVVQNLNVQPQANIPALYESGLTRQYYSNFHVDWIRKKHQEFKEAISN
jgi:hypothetical protein